MKPGKDFSTRFAAAKRWRDDIRPYLEEALKYCCPGREYDFSHTPDQTKLDTQVSTSVFETLASDLGGDFVTYYTPAEVKWCEYLVTAAIRQEDEKAVLAVVQDREDTLFDLIQSSNYNDIAPQWGFEAAIHGTPALWITTSHLAQPIHCESIPPHQLYITPGHNGHLDRFREVTVAADTLVALFQGYPVDLTDRMVSEKMKKPGTNVKVVWGFWLDWKDPARPMWRCEITVDGKRVTPEEPVTLGPMAGSCPLLVGRFNPQAGKPWGRGAGLRAAPDMRVYDLVGETVLSGLDQSLMNTIIYKDDGGVDFSEGIQAGRAYPGGPRFDRNSIYELNRAVNTDQGWYTADRLLDEIRAMFYQDGPRQRGETPPTAAQWLDERRRVQQRLGKPSAPIWSELVYAMVQRFEYLAVQLGKMPDAITHNGQNITVLPISPLQKAQNQDKVMVTRSNLDMIVTVLQDQTANFIDMPQTLENIVRASGDELLVINPEGAPSAAPQPPAGAAA